MEKRPQIWALATCLSLLGFYLLSQCISNTATYNAYSLNELARKDLAQLKDSKALPDGIKDLYEIEKIPTDKISRIWSRRLDLDLPTSSSGNYKLEVLVLQVPNEKLTAILQYHLIHRPSGNSVWELARQYKLFDE